VKRFAKPYYVPTAWHMWCPNEIIRAYCRGRQLFFTKEPFCSILQHIWPARIHNMLMPFYFSC